MAMVSKSSATLGSVRGCTRYTESERAALKLEGLIPGVVESIDHQARLLPYLLSGIYDNSPQVQQASISWMEKLGQQYEEEHHDDVIEKIQYGVDGCKDLYHGKLPHPFSNRPRLGSRMFVRAWARRFINPCLKELEANFGQARKNSAYLLRVIIIYVEDHITMDLNPLVKALLKHY